MALIKCVECGKEMDSSDKKCLKCGANVADIFLRENTKDSLLTLVDEYAWFCSDFFTGEIPTDLTSDYGRSNNYYLENFNVLFGTIYNNEEFVNLVKKYADLEIAEKQLEKKGFSFLSKSYSEYFDEQMKIKEKIEKIIDTFF